jgi:hypothetical protein
MRELGKLAGVLATLALAGCGGSGQDLSDLGGRVVTPADLAFRTGTYQGITSQGLPIFFTVGPTSIEDVSFRWRARCADGHVHTNGIALGGTRIRDGRFSVGGLLVTGGRARVSGRLRGARASGMLSRWANSAFNTVCVARGVTWHAHLASGSGSPL